MLSGTTTSIDQFCDWLQQDLRFAEMPLKVSTSEQPAFKRFMVKIKTEIIRMDQPNFDADETVGKHLDPKTLKSLVRSRKTDHSVRYP